MKNGHIFLVGSVLALTGCSTMQGLKNDQTSGYNAVSNTVAKWVDPEKEAKMALPAYDGTCPSVSVRPDLQKLTEFQNEAKPTDATKVSEAEILHVQNTCRVEKENLVMQVDITVAGKTGPKARIKSSDQPSFAYPYFLAVTDEKGTVLSKEIFAVTLSYGKDKKELTQTENIFQSMPFPNTEAGQVYNVIIGFQLTEDQLKYAQSNPSKKTVSTSGGAPVPVQTTPAPAPQAAPVATPAPAATTPSGAPISLIPSTKTSTNQ